MEKHEGWAPLKRWAPLSTGFLLSAATLTLTVSAQGEVIWDGDPSQGTGIFKIVGSNCESPGSVSAVSDEEMGFVWRYEKSIGSNRCESHGIQIDGEPYAFQNDTTYYFGWWTRVSNDANNNALFQWKAYDDHIQNWPVVLKLVGGDLVMLQRQPDNMVSTIWTGPFEEDTWTHIALGLHLSDELTGGWVELYINGEKQTFNDDTTQYACRLYDGGHVCPKWGVYGAEGELIAHDVAGLLIGDTYDDVKMPGDDPDPGSGGADGVGGTEGGGEGASGGVSGGIGGSATMSSGGVLASGGALSASGGNHGDGTMSDESADDANEPVGCSCSQGGPRSGSPPRLWQVFASLGLVLVFLRRTRLV